VAEIDVTVRGAGAFGLAVAWACARRGARVRVIDPAGVGAGASGGVVGALAPHAPERWDATKAFQRDSLAMAEGWWAEVARAGGGDPGYARTGRLQPIADEAALDRARARAEGAAAHWPGHAWEVVPAPLSAPGGWAPVSPTGLVIRDTFSARLHPARACAALAAALRARGAEILPEGEARGAVVHATGWRGLAELRGPAARPAGAGVKGQAALLALDRAGAPQIYADRLHVVPHADGTVAVGSTTERDWSDEAGTDAALDDVIARARAAVPALAEAPVLRRWAGIRPRARTRAAMLGAWPGRPGHWVANGGFKIGFGLAPLVGEVMAELVLDGDGSRIPDAFAPERSL
jgi:glycine/D-amino acid oxidase-like deaminating enzyme